LPIAFVHLSKARKETGENIRNFKRLKIEERKEKRKKKGEEMNFQ
jgi:hypothetical protein